jgi:hypothetical protein
MKSRPTDDSAIEFQQVWYLPAENEWGDMNILACKDQGTLIVKASSVEFYGSKAKLVISKLRAVTMGKQGRDFVNDWVKVEYDSGMLFSTAFFADGGWLGWRGMFGGTRKIFEAIRQID